MDTNFSFDDTGIDGFDPDKEASAVFNVPVPGNYGLVLSYVDPDNPFKSGTKADPNKPVIWVMLNGTILSYEQTDKHPQEESAYAGRKVFSIYASTQVFQGQGTSKLTDILKSMGYSRDTLARLQAPGGLALAAKLLNYGIENGRPVTAYLGWAWEGKTERLKDESGEPFYVRYEKANSVLKNIPRGLKTDPATGDILYSIPFEFTSPDGETETVTLQPRLNATSFIPAEVADFEMF